MKKHHILIITFLILLSISAFASTQVKADTLTVSVSPTSWTMDVGQSKTFTATPSGGSGSYTGYQWYVGGAVQSGQTASTFSYSPGSAGSPSITVTVTDSLGATSAQSTAPSVTVAASPTVSIAPVGPVTLDVGQVQVFTATPSGGSGTLSYQWYLDGGAVGTNSASYSYTAAGTSHSVTCKVTDSASSPVTSASNAVSVMVNSALVAPTVTPTPGTVNQGQTSSLTSSAVSSGTSPYTYQWHQKAPGGSYVDVGTNSASYSFVTSGSTATGTWSFELQVTDSASTPVVVTSTAVSVTVNAAPATHFVVSGFPSPAVAGVAHSVTVTAKDTFDNTVAGYAGTVKITSSDSLAVLPANAGLTNGVGSFSVTLKTVGSQSITATDTVSSSITGSQTGITVTAGGLDHFVVGAPGSATAGTAFPLTVTAKDASENTVTGYSSSVGLSASAGTISPTSTGTSSWSNGVWTGSVTLTAVGSITITANDGSGHTGTASVTVTAGSLDHITAYVTPTSVAAGSTSTGTATAFDAQNNSLGVVSATWSIPAGGHGGSWSGNVYTSHTAGTFTVQASYSGKTATTSLTVNPSTLDHFLFSTIGSPQTAGSAFSITVTAKDLYNNTVTGYVGTPSLTYSAGSITPTTMNPFVNGQGSISVTVTTTGLSVTITATDGTHTGTSNSFTVNVSTGIHLLISGFPSSTTAGVAQTGTMTAKDAYNNTVTSYTGTVQITSSDSSAVLQTNVVFTSGVGSLPVTLKTAGSQTITATDISISSITGSQTIQVTPAGLNHFGIDVPGTVTAGSTFGSAKVTAYDAYDNVKTDYAGSVYFTSSDTAAILPYSSSSKYSFVSGDRGVHTFTGFTLKTAPSQTITVTDGSVSKQSAPITVNAASLDNFEFDTVGDHTAGSAFSITVTAKDVYGNTVTSYVGTPSLTYSAGSINPTVMSAFVGGVGSTSVTVTAAGSSVTITAVDGTRAGTSNPFAVTLAPTPTPSSTTPTYTPSPTATPRHTSSPTPTPTPTISPPPNSPSPSPSPTTSPLENSGSLPPEIIYYEVAVVVITIVVIAAFVINMYYKTPYKSLKV